MVAMLLNSGCAGMIGQVVRLIRTLGWAMAAPLCTLPELIRCHENGLTLLLACRDKPVSSIERGVNMSDQTPEKDQRSTKDGRLVRPLCSFCVGDCLRI